MDGVAKTLRSIGIPSETEGTFQACLPGCGQPQTETETEVAVKTPEKPEQATCETHRYNPGLETYDREDHICPVCAENRERRKLEQCRQAFLSMGVGRRFQSCQWSDYRPVCPDAEANKNVLREFAKNFDVALERGINGILMGKPGTGKNMLAALVCKTLAANGHTALHTSVDKLVGRIRDTWHRSSTETETQVYQKLLEPELLVIDEVGVQTGSDSEIRIITRVINERYDNRKPVLLLTNLDYDQMEGLLGERIMERFCDDSFVLTFNWPSYRRRNVAKAAEGGAA